LLAGSLYIATPAFAQASQTVTVERVVDGDTVEVNPAVDGTEDMRLIGVDTPETVDPGEPVEPYGPEASVFTTQQLEGKRVVLTFDQERTDQYGRVLAYVRLSGQTNTFNETLLKQGYAQLLIVSSNDRYEARFSQAQDQARQARRGIWRLPKEQQCELANDGNGIGEGSPGCEQQSPEPTPQTPRDPGQDKNCSDYPSQAAAQQVLRSDPEDPFGLDGPKGRSTTRIPGVACEGNDPPRDLRPAPGYGEPTPNPPQPPQNPRQPPQNPPEPPGLPPTGGPPPVAAAALLLGAALIAGRGILRR
jgi:micrococcal nuclease